MTSCLKHTALEVSNDFDHTVLDACAYHSRRTQCHVTDARAVDRAKSCDGGLGTAPTTVCEVYIAAEIAIECWREYIVCDA